MTLNVAKGADLKMSASPRKFSHGHAVTGDEALTECRARIEDAVRSNERIIPDDQWLIVRKLRGVADFTVALDDRVVADNDTVMNNREGSDPDILTIRKPSDEFVS